LESVHVVKFIKNRRVSNLMVLQCSLMKPWRNPRVPGLILLKLFTTSQTSALSKGLSSHSWRGFSPTNYRHSNSYNEEQF